VDLPPSFICTWRLGRFGSLWIDLAGELDPSDCPDLEWMLEKAHTLSNLVVLDMRELTFMDTAGARVIVDASTNARRAGGGLIVARGPSHVDTVFTLTGTAEQVVGACLRRSAPSGKDGWSLDCGLELAGGSGALAWAGHSTGQYEQ
jgi:anti-anti-sigma factor